MSYIDMCRAILDVAVLSSGVNIGVDNISVCVVLLTNEVEKPSCQAALLRMLWAGQLAFYHASCCFGFWKTIGHNCMKSMLSTETTVTLMGPNQVHFH